MVLKTRLLLVAITVFVTSCASYVAFDRSKNSSLTNVVISDQVVLPNNGMYFKDQTAKMTSSVLGAGLIGEAISTSVTAPARERMINSMSANHVRVEQICSNQFKMELEKSKKFTVTSTDKPDAKFILSITRFGFSAIPWQTALRPVVVVEGKLVSPDSAVLWNMTRQMNNHSDPVVPAREFDDYMKDIELVRTGFTAACQVAARDLVADLLGGNPQ